MNSLNLRVSSIKTGENVKKNSEMRTSLMTLPPKYFKKDSECVQIFINATTVPEQVAAVKTIQKNYAKDDESLQFLSDLYFNGPLKHPVRSQISKLLQKSQHNGSKVEEHLEISIKTLIESTKTEQNLANLNSVITSLGGCFENFTQGLRAFERNISKVLPYIYEALKKYLEALSNQTSPSIRNELYLFIHNSIRLVLSCIQEFLTILSANHEADLRKIYEIAYNIMKDPEIPMDIKRNAGLLAAYFVKMFEYSLLDSYYSKRGSEEIAQENISLEICLCAGVINTLTFSDFCCRASNTTNIIRKVVKITHDHSTEPSILLLGTRCLFQLSKNLLTFKLDDNFLEDMKKILKVLTEFCLIYLENHMDSVRHMCKDLMRNILKLEKKFEFEKLLNEIFKACNSDNMPISMKCIILSCAGEVLGSSLVLKHSSNIFDELFIPYLCADLNVNNCYEGLMINNHNETDFETWISTWICFLIDFSSRKGYESLSTVENLINKAIKCDPKVLEVIIGQKHVKGFNHRSIPLRTRLSAMWTVRKNGLKIQTLRNILHKFSGDLKLAMLSQCDDTKIMALRLLVETNKSTEPLTQDECDLILLYVKYNSNCQSPSTREKSSALLLKVLTRFEINFLKIMKEGNNTGHFYGTFLKSLVAILINNLFPSANFSRRFISLQLLKECVVIAINIGLKIDDILPSNTVDVLFNTLNDSYESNKSVAVSILELIEKNQTVKCRKDLKLDVIYNMMTGIKPTDSLTGAYCLEYYCQRLSTREAEICFDIPQTPEYNPIYFAATRWCLSVLEHGLQDASGSILLAAKKNPLYGVLFSLRHILVKLDFQKLALEDKWKNLINSLILICKNLTDVVSPVVNSSSPEGHLPNDFSELPDYLGSEENDSTTACTKILSSKLNISKENVRTTPQMVLLCAWRTVKEVSLILGELVLRSPIEFKDRPDSHYLITINQILEIGSHFRELLSETKHRGAFEQAYVGFSKLCTRLWRVQQPELHELPIKWLTELMEIISNDEKINEKICSTRRSAGVPFMVQALITSELQVGTTKSLNFCMKNLIELILNKEKSTEARTHALNILRALFRCTDLNEAIGEFVSDGVKCSLQAYDAETWSERNSSTLLFSALMTRIFGVQLTKDSENLNIRNKMTGRIFFLRYPDLYDFFLQELKLASEAIVHNKKSDKLYALLLILSRLYPSALEGTESNLKLCVFIPFMSVCSTSPEMHARILAAKAIVPLIAPDRIKNRIYEVMAIIELLQQNGFNPNYLHGLLLQILYLIKSLHKNSNKLQEIINDVDFESIASHLIDICSNTCKNSVVLTTLLEILIECLKRFKNLDIYGNKFDSFMKRTEIFSKEHNFILPKFRKISLIFKLYLQNLKKSETEIAQTLISNLQLEPVNENCEKIKTSLNILVLLLFRDYSEFSDIEEFETTAIEHDFVRHLNENIVNGLYEHFAKSRQLLVCLKCMIRNRLSHGPEYTTKAYALLSRFSKELLFETFNLSELIKEGRNYPSELKCSVSILVATLVNINKINRRESEECLEFLTNITQPWNCFSLRFVATKMLHPLLDKFIESIRACDLQFTVSYTEIILRLLGDDDIDVRTEVSKVILSFVRKSKKAEVSKEMFPADYIAVSTYIQQIFLETIIIDYINISSDNGVLQEFGIKFIEKIIDDHLKSDDNCNERNVDDLEVFDRNEANVFAESRTVVLDCLEILNRFSSIEGIKDVLCKVPTIYQ